MDRMYTHTHLCICAVLRFRSIVLYMHINNLNISRFNDF
uniref:Uncharacterized protein n=1 Tax=Anguilla anguilla TaxID=7936 RepID=A0A0E9RMB7_ANGAN